MRKLTILRRKAYAACLAKMDVYFEDREHPTTTINGYPCRLLGKIKNGETVTFDIPNEGGMLFVTAGGKLTQSTCCEALPIFPGEEDIYLSGQNQYSFFGASAFQFDGVNNEVTNASRAASQKNAMKIFFITLAVCFGVGILLGILSGLLFPAEPYTFESGSLSITLTDDFDDYTEDGTYYVENETYFVAIDAYKISEIAAGEYPELKGVDSLTDLAQFFEDSDGDGYANTKGLTKENGLYYYEYTYTEALWTYQYGQYFFEHDGYYYSVIFGADSSDYDAAQVNAWAATVTFD